MYHAHHLPFQIYNMPIHISTYLQYAMFINFSIPAIVLYREGFFLTEYLTVPIKYIISIEIQIECQTIQRKLFKKSIVSTFHFITFIRNTFFRTIYIGKYCYFMIFIHLLTIVDHYTRMLHLRNIVARGCFGCEHPAQRYLYKEYI